jgi:NAD(P)-dependent dehydrogenase (short-subunit alcohol dehydrogenase family)
MKGKTVVITGATAGIGKAAAIKLATLGADLALVARNLPKAEGVAAEIQRRVPRASVRVFLGDLASLDSVRTVAKELEAELPQIDVLINNAGVAATASRRTNDGYDEMLAANYLGPVLLTHLLLDRLRASAPSRVVVTGSEAHRLPGRFDVERFEELGPYSTPWAAQLAYGRTKLLDILFADELARRLDPAEVTVNSLCPGFVATELVREAGSLEPMMRVMSRTPFVRTPAQGARIVVKLASSAELEGVSGRFCTSTPGAGLIPSAGPRRDPAVARRVYQRTCDLLGIAPVPLRP